MTSKPTSELILSEDGSHTVKSAHFQATYHSTHGAIAESNTVFIDAGLRYTIDTFNERPIKVLEMGFGTGLNPLLTLAYANENEIPIHYTGVEAYPIAMETVDQLNYADYIANISQDDLANMHGIDVNESILDNTISPYFTFSKLISKMEDIDLDTGFHLVYYDAFGPGTQPELWQEDILSKMYAHMTEEGILVTYCAQGAFKRALKAVGFRVEALPGPKGKREMTRAIKV